MKIVLGVAGGIAAYKACSLLRLLTEDGHDVTVVPTQAALRFVGAPTWAALSGRPVATEVWDAVHEVRHVRLGQEADLVVVAPATADLLARAAHGLADDLLTNVLLTASGPVVLAPAMHTEMWEHAATQANVAILSERGVHIVPPASGRLTGADTGPGRLPEPEELYAVCRRVLAQGRPAGPSQGAFEATPVDAPATGDLAGRHIVVSAGGTREPLDPVRYLGNRSSGKQGYALARTALARGARVTLVAANTTLPDPPGALVVPVGTAEELADAVRSAVAEADAVVMAAAVADFRPAAYTEHKIKKTHDPGDPDAAPVIELVRNPDVLAGLVAARGDATTPVIVGFAAETGDESGDVLALGRAKLLRKGCDILVVNEVGADKTFGRDDNLVHILRQGSSDDIVVGPTSKDDVADAVWDTVRPLL